MIQTMVTIMRTDHHVKNRWATDPMDNMDQAETRMVIMAVDTAIMLVGLVEAVLAAMATAGDMETMLVAVALDAMVVVDMQ
ncbi:unnamed protein product, partial [Aphanomyces euteiches]